MVMESAHVEISTSNCLFQKRLEDKFWRGKKASKCTDVGVSDVLCWIITETWLDTLTEYAFMGCTGTTD